MLTLQFFEIAMSVFKKQPKKFYGTPAWKKLDPVVPVLPESSEESSTAGPTTSTVERPVPVPLSACHKKFAASGTSSSPVEEDKFLRELEGYRLVNCQEYKRNLEAQGQCPKCNSSLTLSESLPTKRGLVSNLRTVCSNESCHYSVTITDPYSKSTKSLNTRSVFAMRSIGCGLKGLSAFCGAMDMLPPLSKSCFSEHVDEIAHASQEAAKESMLAAAKYLHALHGAESTETIDVPVTCDGTWSKRGSTAAYGVVVVISWETGQVTGQVLDCEILSKRCQACEQQKTRWGRSLKSSRHGWKFIRIAVPSTMWGLYQQWSVRV